MIIREALYLVRLIERALSSRLRLADHNRTPRQPVDGSVLSVQLMNQDSSFGIQVSSGGAVIVWAHDKTVVWTFTDPNLPEGKRRVACYYEPDNGYYSAVGEYDNDALQALGEIRTSNGKTVLMLIQEVFDVEAE